MVFCTECGEWVVGRTVGNEAICEKCGAVLATWNEKKQKWEW